MMIHFKKYLVLAFLFFTISVDAKNTPTDQFALGVVVGDPTAITGKYWLDTRIALDGGIAFSFDSYALAYGDYLIHYPQMFGDKNKFVTELDFYYGFGALVAITTRDRDRNDYYLGRRSGSTGVAVRIPFGIEWRPTEPPIGVFAEIVPGVSVIPATSVVVQGGFGVRYYF